MMNKAAVMSVPVRRILTIHPNGVDNLIFTLPALRALRESFPGARIGAVAPNSLQSLMRQSRDVDDILPRRYRGISSQTALWVKLREQHFDMAICFSTSRYATLMAFASGAAVRAGFNGARLGKLLTHQVSKETATGADAFIILVQSLGCRAADANYRGLLDVSPENLQTADKLLAECGIESTFAIIAPGKSTFNELWNQTITGMAAKMPVVIAGMNAVHGVRAQCDLSGKTELPVLAALCARATVCLGSDSGILHLAACLGTPVVAIDDSAEGRLLRVRGVPNRLLSADETLQAEQILSAVDEVQYESRRQ
jgi:ADP-heptose:LPS heptosyltransferase